MRFSHRHVAAPGDKTGQRAFRDMIRDRWMMTCELDAQSGFASYSTSWGLSSMKIVVADMASQTWAWNATDGEVGAWRDNAVVVKLVEAGQVTMLRRGTTQIAKAGDLMITQPGDGYDKAFTDGTRLIALCIPLQTLDQHGILNRSDDRILPESNSPELTVIGDLIRWGVSLGPNLNVGLRNRIGEQILGMIDLLVDERSLESSSPPRRDRTLNRAKHYIANHYRNASLNPEQIAVGAFATVSYLNRLFRVQGTTLMQYVWDLRLKLAKDLLCASHDQSPICIQTIAEQCGFTSHSHFSRQFKRKYGITPSQAASDFSQNIADGPLPPSFIYSWADT